MRGPADAPGSLACDRCGHVGVMESRDRAGSTYCAGCTQRELSEDVGQLYMAEKVLDLALAGALSAGVTRRRLFEHVAARLDQHDELEESWIATGGGVLTPDGPPERMRP